MESLLGNKSRCTCGGHMGYGVCVDAVGQLGCPVLPSFASLYPSKGWGDKQALPYGLELPSIEPYTSQGQLA